jgi:hypothetical protein
MMPKDTPTGVLRDILAKRPNIGRERLLRVFEAHFYDDAELRRAVIQHAFASALFEISAAGLLAFGLYGIAEAAYRRISPP